MAKKTAPLLPATDARLRQLGVRLRLARLRRRLSAKQVAERAGMAPMTLRSVERGGSGVTMGAYLSVMQVLGIEKDLDLLGKADPLGRELQDAHLSTRIRNTSAKSPPSIKGSAGSKPSAASGTAESHAMKSSHSISSVQRVAKSAPSAPHKKSKKSRQPSEAAPSWTKKNGLVSAESLAGLIVPASPKRKAR